MSANPQDQAPAAPPESSQVQATGLSRLLLLFQQMRRSETAEELLFLAMNETRQVIAYDEALLFFTSDGKDPAVQCISGLATFERETPKIAWLEENIMRLHKRDPHLLEPIIVSGADLPEADRESWNEFLSAQAIIVPFFAGRARQHGFFLFTRTMPWTEKDTKLLGEIAENFSYVYSAHKLKAGVSFMNRLRARKQRIRIGVGIAAILVLFWPIHETLIADMEVTPVSPWVATAPIDGVIRKIHVEPNAPVKTGDLLFEMDDTSLRNEALLSQERLEIARQELWQARQQVVTRTGDDKRADAAILALEVQKKENEAKYYNELLEKSKVFATNDGIAVFSSPSEIEGKPTHTGEAVMLIADPAKVEMTINMPANDAIILKPGDKVTAYLNATPFDPLKAKIRYVSYKAQRTEIADQFAYKIKADIEVQKTQPRLGLKGSARVKGERTTLFYVIFRKPIAYVRRMTGI